MRNMEKEVDDGGIVVRDINENDVLIGRGEHISTYPGNVTLNGIIAERRQEYLESEKADKTRIIDGILIQMSELTPPGRFIKEDAGVWKSVGTKNARAKVRAALAKSKDVASEQPGTNRAVTTPTYDDSLAEVHTNSNSGLDCIFNFLREYEQVFLECVCVVFLAYTWKNARHEKMINDDSIGKDAIIDSLVAISLVCAWYAGIRCSSSRSSADIRLHVALSAGLGIALNAFFGMGGTAGIAMRLAVGTSEL